MILFLLNFKFVDCQLNVASFYKLNLQNTLFKNCNLQEVDFTEVNLSKAILDNCDLKNGVFQQSNLESTNFKTAINFNINPSENNMKNAIFSRETIEGLLQQFQIKVE